MNYRDFGPLHGFQMIRQHKMILPKKKTIFLLFCMDFDVFPFFIILQIQKGSKVHVHHDCDKMETQ